MMRARIALFCVWCRDRGRFSVGVAGQAPAPSRAGCPRADARGSRRDTRAAGELRHHARQPRLCRLRAAVGKGRRVSRRHGQLRQGPHGHPRSPAGAPDEERLTGAGSGLSPGDEPDRRRGRRRRHGIQPRHVGHDQHRESTAGHHHRQLLRPVRARGWPLEVQAPSDRRHAAGSGRSR